MGEKIDKITGSGVMHAKLSDLSIMLATRSFCCNCYWVDGPLLPLHG